MIVSKTPFRMSFVGGGSDLPAFYREEVGAVLSTSIDKTFKKQEITVSRFLISFLFHINFSPIRIASNLKRK